MDPDELTASGLRYDVSGAVATVTLDRPEVRNAQMPRMWRALAAVGFEIPDDVRVVVLRGAGKSFSAGLDRSMLVSTGSTDGGGSTEGHGAGRGESVTDLVAMSDGEASS